MGARNVVARWRGSEKEGSMGEEQKVEDEAEAIDQGVAPVSAGAVRDRLRPRWG
jgi:hypothetical protein